MSRTTSTFLWVETVRSSWTTRVCPATISLFPAMTVNRTSFIEVDRFVFVPIPHPVEGFSLGSSYVIISLVFCYVFANTIDVMRRCGGGQDRGEPEEGKGTGYPFPAGARGARRYLVPNREPH